jgi:hypothetical protein
MTPERKLLLQKVEFERYIVATNALKGRYGYAITNIFFSVEKIRALLNTKKCLFFCTEQLLLLAVPMHDAFLKLHFLAKDADSLCEGIKMFEQKYDKSLPLTCEIIGREGFVKEIATTLAPIGFLPRKRIRRMDSRRSDALPQELEDLSENDVRFAEKGDATEVLELFRECFDLYSDSLPEMDELQKAIEKKQVVLLRRDGCVAAAHYFEIIGKTLHGWFDCTKKEFRKQFAFWEIQLFMAKHFHDIGFRPNRVVGWRDMDNARLMKMALMNHEIPEDMVDYILMKSYASPQEGEELPC